MWRRTFTIIIVLFALTAALLASRSAGQKGRESSPADGAAYVAAEGRVSVKPDQRAVLAAEVAGRIESILVDNLSPVRKGELLAILSNTDLQQQIHQTEQAYLKAQARYQEMVRGYRSEEVEEAFANVRSAEARLELARKDEERDQRLFEEEVIARSRLDATIAERKRAEADLAAAQERYRKMQQGERQEVIAAAQAEMMAQKYGLESLKAAYDKTFIRCPLDGIVIRRYRNAAEFADTGQAILEVANLNEMIVEADVNELDSGKVRPGMKVLITSDAFPGQKFQGELYEISAALKQRESDPEDPSVIIDQKILPVKARFLDSIPLKLDMKVDLRILL